MRKIICITLLFILMATSVHAVQKLSDKQFGQVQPDKALVYLVRTSHLSLGARTQFVYSDQSFLSALDNSTYTFVQVDPGQHLIWTNWTSVQKNMEFVAGQVYYLNIFEQVNLIPQNEGETLVNNPDIRFAKSTDKEIAKSAEHIANRYSRAVTKMEKDVYVAPPSNENSAALQPKQGAVQVAKGTPVTITLLENVSSSRVQAGQEIMFAVTNPVMQGGARVIAQGTPIKGIVQHVNNGKTGGKAGALDIVVSIVNAVDGNPVPVAGQISVMGEDRSNKASTATMFGGLTGLLITKSREGFLLSQTQYQVPIKSDVYIVPSYKSVASNVSKGTSEQQAYTATIQKPVTFAPSKKTKVDDVFVELPSQFKWDKLSLVSAQGIDLPVQLMTTQKTDDTKKQIFVYSGWGLVRFLPLGLNAKDYQLNFLAESGGQNFPITATLNMVIK